MTSTGGPDVPLPAGTQLGRYEIRRLLGQGGFGMVFAAHDLQLGRDVALKILLPEHTVNTQLLQRFLQEARAAAKIQHPAIVTIHEIGRITGTTLSVEGSAFIVMEMVRGESLASRLAAVGRVTPSVAIELGREIASALAAAHRTGIIHRDLKPDNLMLARDPVAPLGERIKVLDFGIAKLAEATMRAQEAQLKTGQGAFGTPRYMSPEQFRSAANVDARTDIYALGCILFEIVAGRPLFAGDFVQLLDLHTSGFRPLLRTLVADVPDWFEQLVAAMVAADIDKRPRSMDDVERALAGPGGFAATTPSPPSAPVSPVATTLGSAAGAISGSPRPSRSRNSIIGAIAAVAVVAVVATVVVTRMSHRDTPESTSTSTSTTPAAAPAPPPAEPAPAGPQPAAATPIQPTPVQPSPPVAHDVPAPPPPVTHPPAIVKQAPHHTAPHPSPNNGSAGSGSAGVGSGSGCATGDTLCNFKH